MWQLPFKVIYRYLQFIVPAEKRFRAHYLTAGVWGRGEIVSFLGGFPLKLTISPPPPKKMPIIKGQSSRDADARLAKKRDVYRSRNWVDSVHVL